MPPAPSEDAAEHLFVYGTLRRGAGHPMHAVLSRLAERAGGAIFRGRLYWIAGFPGAVDSDDARDEVRGEVYRLIGHPVLRQGLLARLDAYEGCAPSDPEPRAFSRGSRTVRLETGRPIEAWVYLYALSTDGLRRIESGDFLDGAGGARSPRQLG
jgi:gamma-glutamylcyclotransferase (GGCT)/AIG2-like uncharacterized protein YtfP